MNKTNTPSIDPLFNKPHDYISGIVDMDPEKVRKLNTYTQSKEKVRPKYSRKGIKKAIAATAISGGLLLANYANNSISEADKRATTTFEEDALKISEKTLLKGSIEFNPGVNVRRYPSVVNEDENNEGNLAFTIAEGQKLVLEDPVIVSTAPEESWYAFTMNKGGSEGKDPITLWVSSDVVNQTTNEGNPYATLGLEGLYDDGLRDNIFVDAYGSMSVNGEQVSIGHIES